MKVIISEYLWVPSKLIRKDASPLGYAGCFLEIEVELPVVPYIGWTLADLPGDHKNVGHVIDGIGIDVRRQKLIIQLDPGLPKDTESMNSAEHQFRQNGGIAALKNEIVGMQAAGWKVVEVDTCLEPYISKQSEDK